MAQPSKVVYGTKEITPKKFFIDDYKSLTYHANVIQMPSERRVGVLMWLLSLTPCVCHLF